MKPLVLLRKASAVLGEDGLLPGNLPSEFQALFPEESPKYIDPISLLAGIGAGRIFRQGENPLSPAPDDAVILGTAFGALESSLEFDRQALLKGPNTVNPMDFPNTVANAAGSRIGIWLQLKGPNVTLTNGGTSFIDALGFAWEGMNGGLFSRCLVGAVEKAPDFLNPTGVAGKLPFTMKSGAFLLLGAVEGEGFLQVNDYFSVQWKPDGTLPLVYQELLKGFFVETEWLGLPLDSLMEKFVPQGIARFSPEASILELGLSGKLSLESFLDSSHCTGVLGAVAAEERRISLVKIKREKRSL